MFSALGDLSNSWPLAAARWDRTECLFRKRREKSHVQVSGVRLALAEAQAHEAGRGWKLGEGRVLQKRIKMEKTNGRGRTLRAEVLHRACTRVQGRRLYSDIRAEQVFSRLEVPL